MGMRGGGRRLIDWVRAVRHRRPLVAAVVASGATLLLVAVVIVLVSPLRTRLTAQPSSGPGYTTSQMSSRPGASVNAYPYPAVQNPASGPYAYPASGPYANPASGPYPPQAYPASASYPPFYPPASSGPVGATLPIDCRLPVTAGPPGSGGFIAFPGGTFIADPASSVALPTPSPGEATPPPGPGPGYGYAQGLSYDRPLSRWVPVPANQVSPDGSHYAYTSPSGLYIVQVSTGTQVEVGEGHPWLVVSVQNDGVYAGDANAGGLWFFSTLGTSRQVSSSGYWQAGTSTAAFGTPTSAVPQGATNVIVRLDLKTGKVANWFTREGTQSQVAGFDLKGDLIVYVRYLNVSAMEVWVVTGPTSAAPITGVDFGYYSQGFNPTGNPIADSHGVWFAGTWSQGYGSNQNGVALYVAGSGFYWMSSLGGQLAGACA